MTLPVLGLTLGDVADIVDAGGIFGYARRQGMI